jgi:hypothetical protein
VTPADRLRQAFDEHDRQLGLGPGGSVLAAVRDVARAEPSIGSAQFEITVTGAGAVDVRVVSGSNDLAAWTQMADRLAAALKRKLPRIPAGRNGVRLTIDVVAREQLANGSSTAAAAPRVVPAMPVFRPTDESKEELARRNPVAAGRDSDAPTTPLVANSESPGVFVQGRGKLGSVRAGVNVLGRPEVTGSFDPSNIGARANRVVSTRIVSQVSF